MAELLTGEKFGAGKSLSLTVYILQAHQTSTDRSNPMVSQRALINPGETRNKINRCEHERDVQVKAELGEWSEVVVS